MFLNIWINCISSSSFILKTSIFHAIAEVRHLPYINLLRITIQGSKSEFCFTHSHLQPWATTSVGPVDLPLVHPIAASISNAEILSLGTHLTYIRQTISVPGELDELVPGEFGFVPPLCEFFHLISCHYNFLHLHSFLHFLGPFNVSTWIWIVQDCWVFRVYRMWWGMAD